MAAEALPLPSPHVKPASFSRSSFTMSRHASDTMLMNAEDPGCSPFRPSSSGAPVMESQPLDPKHYPCLQSPAEHSPQQTRRRWSSLDDATARFERCAAEASHPTHHRRCFTSLSVTNSHQLQQGRIRRSSLKSHGSTSSLRSASSNKSTVSFSTVEIRSYEVILGDNPSCSSGPPLSLGWRYEPDETMTAPVDDYERQMNAEQADGRPLRRRLSSDTAEELLLPRDYRESALLWAGYSSDDIAQSVRNCCKIKRQRRQTCHNLHFQKMEELAEKVGRMIRKSRRRKVAEENDPERFWNMYKQSNYITGN